MPKPLPENLGELTRDQLSALMDEAIAEAEPITSKTDATRAELAQLAEIAAFHRAVKAAREELDSLHAEADSARASLVRDPAPEPPAVVPTPAPAPVAPAPVVAEVTVAEVEAVVQEAEAALEGELVTASAASARDKTAAEDLLRKASLNNRIRGLSFREAARKQAERNGFRPYESDEELVITTAADVPGYMYDQPLNGRLDLANAFQRRAKAMVNLPGQGQRVTVATVKKSFDTVIDDRMSPDDIEAAFKQLGDPSRLYTSGEPITAGGGWCALPVPTYNFFNITCEDGAFDAPTFGVERSGVIVPVSPSMLDVYTGSFTSGTNPWLWTNTDDVATVTGSPNKPCVRVPCATTATFTLECYGICLTAGNLTNAAWPEQTANFLRLLRSAQFHAINARYIQTVVSLASAVVTAGAAGAGLIAPLLSQIELQATNYRVKYGMCNTEVLEIVLPFWIIGAMRADFSRRQGVSREEIGITDNQIADWFDARHVRAQFVSDWQVRASGQIGNSTPITSWPTSVDFLLYAAGTVMIGNGMTLDLGVVRDSVLNAENDYTAAWAEECHLVAKFGHEIGQFRVNICPDGTVGAADLTACM